MGETEAKRSDLVARLEESLKRCAQNYPDGDSDVFLWNARRSLEAIALAVIPNQTTGSKKRRRDDLGDLLEELKGRETVSRPLALAMEAVRSAGNLGSHTQRPGDEPDRYAIKVCATNLPTIVHWFLEQHTEYRDRPIIARALRVLAGEETWPSETQELRAELDGTKAQLAGEVARRRELEGERTVTAAQSHRQALGHRGEATVRVRWAPLALAGAALLAIAFGAGFWVSSAKGPRDVPTPRPEARIETALAIEPDSTTEPDSTPASSREDPQPEHSAAIEAVAEPTQPRREADLYIEVAGRAGHLRIQRSEASVGQYRACVMAGRCEGTAGPEGLPAGALPELCSTGAPEAASLPINCIDPEEAQRLCEFLDGRLPTSEEWEIATDWRAAVNRAWADEARRDVDRPNVCDRSFRTRYPDDPYCREEVATAGWTDHAVGPARPGTHEPATPDGLDDVLGNVAEIVRTEEGFALAGRGFRSPLPQAARAVVNRFQRSAQAGVRCVSDVSSPP